MFTQCFHYVIETEQKPNRTHTIHCQFQTDRLACVIPFHSFDWLGDQTEFSCLTDLVDRIDSIRVTRDEPNKLFFDFESISQTAQVR